MIVTDARLIVVLGLDVMGGAAMIGVLAWKPSWAGMLRLGGGGGGSRVYLVELCYRMESARYGVCLRYDVARRIGRACVML